MPFVLCSGIVSSYGATGTLNNDVKIREFPSMKAKTVATRKKGRELEILQKVDGGKDGYWYQTPKGYIYETFVDYEELPQEKTEEPKEVIVAEPIVIVTPTPEPILTPIEVQKIEEAPVVITPVVVQVEEKPEAPLTITPPIITQEIVVIEPTVEKKEVELATDTNTTHEELATPITANFEYAASFINEPEPKEEPKAEEQPVVQEQPTPAEPPKEERVVQQEEPVAVVTQQEPVIVATQKQPFQKYFIGIGFGLNSLDVKKQDQVGSIILNNTPDDSASSFLFLGGINLPNNGRIYGNYEILNLDDVKINAYYLSYDYIFPHILNPYIGLSFGMSDLEWQRDPLVNSQTKDNKLSSLLYGIQGGIEYPIENQLSIYSQISYQKLDFKTNLLSTPAKCTITHESKQSLSIGVKYSF